MKKLLLILLCLPMIVFGQEWEKRLLHPSSGQDVQQTSDGGYIITGERWDATWSLNGTYLLKVNNNGIEQWSKDFNMFSSLNMDGHVGGHSVQQTSDGGYIITGNTGLGAGFLIKTDGSGNSAWEHYFVGDGLEDVFETSDGGFIVTGRDTVIKTDINGNYQWSLEIDHYGYSIIQTSDGGYVVCGYGGVIPINPSADRVASVTKIDNTGGILWHQVHGDHQNTYSAVLTDIQQTSDGGYILTGDDHRSTHNSAWLIKLNSFGYFEWEETFNGLSYEESDGQSIDMTSDGGYIITGTRTDDNNYWRVLLIKTDGQGNLEWERTFGGIVGPTDMAYGHSVQQTSDGGYIITGSIYDNAAGFYETYLIKTNSQGNVTSTFNIPINPNRNLEKTVDILGKQTKPQTNTPFIEIYDDGTVEKRIIIE